MFPALFVVSPLEVFPALFVVSPLEVFPALFVASLFEVFPALFVTSALEVFPAFSTILLTLFPALALLSASPAKCPLLTLPSCVPET